MLKKLAKPALLLVVLTGSCHQNDPTCLPYEGVILPHTFCAGDRVVMKVLNKNLGDAYFFGADSVHHAVSAVFPDTIAAPLARGQKVYFNYQLMEKHDGVLCQAIFGGAPRTQIKITRLSYTPCRIGGK